MVDQAILGKFNLNKWLSGKLVNAKVQIWQG